MSSTEPTEALPVTSLTPPPTPPPTTKSIPGLIPAGIGDKVNDGAFAFVVNRAGTTEALPSPANPLKIAHGVYVVVEMVVENTGDRPQSYSDEYQKLKDDAGHEFPADPQADLLLNKGIQTTISPGDRVNVKVVFDVPDGATPTEIELHESPISDGKSVRVYSR
ncbi:DUF4352 domain-containing protein [Mycobacterium sp. CVI_P3]|uniref:DUF4352 domain-containing protein n=1 Tax=Mycobacterium pinniadriaticum TaxID=2994102 RepID=A0ABT3SEP3_9MYCO|nr:DUF4352 domain-containing protein [Mycobacterium pinniadriaticum]MCX2931192.1 DUF4352 domain-containing protein [Mycobacterium pinniadriaticum]MCX2937584.1 DUF4352 domain-containing protein [Mycobacterium pinniadriaticum]